MTIDESLTIKEILSQTLAWSEAIQVIKSIQPSIAEINNLNIDQILFIGCGSTHYLSLSAASLMQSLSGIISRGIPSSEMIHSAESVIAQGKHTVVCATSRSGNTTETLRAVEKSQSNKLVKYIITISNNPDSPLAKMGNLNITIPVGFDKSVAQTKSFSSMYVAATGLATLVGNRQDLFSKLQNLIPIGERILKDGNHLAKKFGEDQNIRQFFFLGSGINYGLACEASLKLKEMSLTVSEPFHFLEFRHGPISMIDDRTVVVGLLSEDKKNLELPVLIDAKKLGAQLLVIGERDCSINFLSELPEVIRGVLNLPALQLMAYYRARSYGLNPDQPRNLSAVVRLEDL